MSMLEGSLVYKPFKYPWCMDTVAAHENIHWVPEEVDLQKDVEQFKTVLTSTETNLITQILRMFTTADVAVAFTYCELIPKFKNNEIRSMFLSFAAREVGHQRAYALLNDTLGMADEEFIAFKDYVEMQGKVDWMTDTDVNSVAGLALTLAKQTFCEGVSLFASFIMLLNFARHGKMLGMNKVVRWSI